MLQEFVLSGAKEAAEEVDAMKEPADTSRAEETVSQPLPSPLRVGMGNRPESHYPRFPRVDVCPVPAADCSPDTPPLIENAST